MPVHTPCRLREYFVHTPLGTENNTKRLRKRFRVHTALLVANVQGVPKNPQAIENDLLLEFQWPST